MKQYMCKFFIRCSIQKAPFLDNVVMRPFIRHLMTHEKSREGGSSKQRGSLCCQLSARPPQCCFCLATMTTMRSFDGHIDKVAIVVQKQQMQPWQESPKCQRFFFMAHEIIYQFYDIFCDGSTKSFQLLFWDTKTIATWKKKAKAPID